MSSVRSKSKRLLPVTKRRRSAHSMADRSDGGRLHYSEERNVHISDYRGTDHIGAIIYAKDGLSPVWGNPDTGSG